MQFASRGVLAIGVVSGALTAAACTSPAHPTKTTIIPWPKTVCPVPPQIVESSNGQPIVVTYGSPTVTDGTKPVTTSCTPASGSSFNLGPTTVTCRTTDAVQRTSSCSFAITVIPPSPHLAKTKFLAFGDSITAGAVPESYTPTRFRVLKLLPPGQTYPGQLEMMLKQRYLAQQQQLLVINDGLQRERADEGVNRLDTELLLYRPDVLLLLEGINDLDQTTSIEATVLALQSMIIDARDRRGADVIIGTLLPQNVEECSDTYGSCAGNARIIAFNSQLTAMARSQHVVVVDLYEPFAPHAVDVPDWLTSDGLHPNETGYQQLAQLFFTAIRATYELPR